MPELDERIQEALVEGATRGLSGDDLFAFVRKECPKAKSKRIVREAFMTLSDPNLKDRNILDVIYSLALNRRLGGDDVDPESTASPKPGDGKKSRRRDAKTGQAAQL